MVGRSRVVVAERMRGGRPMKREWISGSISIDVDVFAVVCARVRCGLEAVAFHGSLRWETLDFDLEGGVFECDAAVKLGMRVKEPSLFMMVAGLLRSGVISVGSRTRAAILKCLAREAAVV
jgi:hypothetical protein